MSFWLMPRNLTRVLYRSMSRTGKPPPGSTVFLLLLAPIAHASETFEGYTFYGGDPHVHSGVSGDGYSSDVGPNADDTYNALSDIDALAAEAGLDWVALTDHTNDVFTAASDDWAYGWSFVLDHDDDATGIVLVPAAELAFTAGTDPLGHKNVYFFGDEDLLAGLTVADFAHDGSTSRDIGSCEDLEAYLEDLGSNWGEILVIPHHPMPTRPAATDWECFQEAYTPAVEVYSSWGNSLDPDADYDPSLRGVTASGSVYTAIEEFGYALGFWGGSDNHFTSPGGLDHRITSEHASSGGITIAVLEESEAWSRENLYAAILDRRTLASSGPVLPFVVEYSSSGWVVGTLGEAFEYPEEDPLTVTLRIPTDHAEAVTDAVITGPDGDVAMTRLDATTWVYTWTTGTAPEWSYAWVSVDGPTFFGDAYVDDSNDTDEERVWASPSWAMPVPADTDRDGYERDTWGGQDCDDHAAEIHPGAHDAWYDGVDRDCDGANDYDADGDGHESADWGGDDCDDDDLGVHPGAVETWYDGVDQDCDGASDYDADGDGYRTFWFGGGDCDDTDPAVHPRAVEVWYDGVDQDCDHRSDFDADRDGYESDAWGGADCDDADRAIHPWAHEIWYDGEDRNCDGSSDYDADHDGHDADAWGGDDCDDGARRVHPGAAEIWYDGVDQDCDGASDYDADGDGHASDAFGGDDCNDARADAHPGGTEIWYDGVDQDCDGSSDFDADADGYDIGHGRYRDCDDGDPDVRPGAEEIWYDGVDQDCDRGDDFDADGDGWSLKSDCDDTDPDAWPGGPGWTEDCSRIPGFASGRSYRGEFRRALPLGCATAPARPWPLLLLLAASAALARRRRP